VARLIDAASTPTISALAAPAKVLYLRRSQCIHKPVGVNSEAS
jgi:hypothetical protein